MADGMRAIAKSAFREYLESCAERGGSVGGFKNYVAERYTAELRRFTNETESAALSRWWNEFSKLSVSGEGDESEGQADLFLGDQHLPLSVSLPSDKHGAFVQKITRHCTIEELGRHAQLVRNHGVSCMQRFEQWAKFIEDALEVSDGDRSWTVDQVIAARFKDTG